jgi:hypothetical protein
MRQLLTSYVITLLSLLIGFKSPAVIAMVGGFKLGSNGILKQSLLNQCTCQRSCIYVEPIIKLVEFSVRSTVLYIYIYIYI